MQCHQNMVHLTLAESSMCQISARMAHNDRGPQTRVLSTCATFAEAEVHLTQRALWICSFVHASRAIANGKRKSDRDHFFFSFSLVFWRTRTASTNKDATIDVCGNMMTRPRAAADKQLLVITGASRIWRRQQAITHDCLALDSCWGGQHTLVITVTHWKMQATADGHCGVGDPESAVSTNGRSLRPQALERSSKHSLMITLAWCSGTRSVHPLMIKAVSSLQRN